MKGMPVNVIQPHCWMLPHLTRSCRTRAVLLFLIISSLAAHSSAWAQTETADCAKQLDRAEDQYYQGHFDDAIQMAEACLTRRDLPEDLEIRAHKIIAKASVSKRHVDRAKEELRKILAIDDKVTLDPDLEPPEVIKLFEEVRQEQKQGAVKTPEPQTKRPTPTPGGTRKPQVTEKKKKDNEKGWFARNWYFVAGGAVATGAAVAVLAGGGNDKVVLPDLPLPPSFP